MANVIGMFVMWGPVVAAGVIGLVLVLYCFKFTYDFITGKLKKKEDSGTIVNVAPQPAH